MTSGIRIIPQNVAPTPEPAPDPLKEREAAFNAVLMAVMAGRRVMVLSDGHPDAGRTLGRRMAGHMDSSCGLGLVATARRGATVEDLLVQVSADLGAGGSDDLERLALALERGLEAAGSGLLVVLDAHLLDAGTIADLFELSGSDTDDGLYMQVLLTGSPALDRLFDRPALAGAARQVASARWSIGQAAPEPDPVPEAPPDIPPPAPAAARPASPAEPRPRVRNAAPPAMASRPAELRRRSRPVTEEAAARPASRPVPLHLLESDPEPARTGRRGLRWAFAGLLVLLAFGAGFVTNALWPAAPRTTAELLDGDGRSALTAGLPSPPAARAIQLPEPERLPAEPAPPPAAVALPPEWEQPADRNPQQPSQPRSAASQQQAPQRPAVSAAPAPIDERPVVAPPVRLAPQPQPSEPAPRRQVAQEPASPRDVCAEGAGGRAAPDASLSGFAQGFMSDLRSLGRCLGSLAQP
ncbi:hypothetical protein IGS68_14120 [Skermanella sp. TT6]|uniref:Uncharacterized protein n=1 Tax=Skermanella cutis TaxID=2775420 RepID=A0ABX7AZ42_9PROT|nr:ATP-binding protein [Skermanella sp. TT6]QQP87261.1 hypothetical protein IGS68_14120 [Skermanella sp. TT6]